MSYLKKINDLLETTILKNTTSKILQHMGRIRNASSLNQARRWVMELIQNAQDVSFDEGIRIRITQTDRELIFAHTGKPFRVKDILSIINQASSKDESIEAVGKFGTGFVTTFQLSESVRLKSVLYDQGETHIPFEIVLDRSGKTDEEIQESIIRSMDQLKACVANEDAMDYQPEEYNTSFIYSLTGDYERTIAHTGIVDLEHTINEILSFSDKILEICVVIDTADEKKAITYTVKNEEILDREKGITKKTLLWDCTENNLRSVREHHVVYIKEDTLALAVTVDEQKQIQKIDADKARIYIDFPLVGTEQFPFPVIVNDRRLHPNEPRSGITLVDSERSDEAADNKVIMDRAVGLYGKLLDYFIKNEYGQIWNMIEIPVWKDSAEMSQTWVQTHIYDGLYQIFSREEIVDTDQGKKTLVNSTLRFAVADTPREKEEIQWLIRAQEKYFTAECEVDWPEILKGYCVEQSRIHTINLDTVIRNMGRILAAFAEENKAMEWLNHLYKTCMKNELYRTAIRSGEIRMYPNQVEGEFRNYRTLYTHFQIKADRISDTLLWEIAECFLGNEHMKNYRKLLVDRRFDLEKEDLEAFTDADLAGCIENYVNYIVHSFKIDSLNQNIQLGCAKLAEWIAISMEKDEKARIYFPEYCSEEGRAKLLTSKAVALMSRNLRETAQQLQQTKDELENKEQEIQKLREELAQKESCFGKDSFWGEAWSQSEDPDTCGMFAGETWFSREELDEYGGEAEDFGRMVGDAGERFALEKLQTMFVLNNKLDTIDGLMQVLFDSQLTYEIIRSDTECYKQPGFDLILYGKDDTGSIVTTDYFEVKTHTTRSRLKHVFHLSEEQMKLAMRQGKHYHALLVSYDTKKNACVGITAFSDVLGTIADGKWVHENGYRFIAR